MKDKQRSTSQVEDKHTPGPWHVERDNGIYAKDQYIGLSLRGLTYDKGLPYKANARLMAAAPEMYDVLKSIYPMIGQKGRAIIDKIEGDE